ALMVLTPLRRWSSFCLLTLPKSACKENPPFPQRGTRVRFDRPERDWRVAVSQPLSGRNTGKRGEANMRKGMLALLALMLATVVAGAQGWAEKMFKGKTSHDFGTVPRGAQLVYRFTMTNIYAVQMEIENVKSGCGCVTAKPAKRILAPRESTTIEVR